MRKEMTRIFAITFISLIIISFFAFIVSAATDEVTPADLETGAKVLAGGIRGFFIGLFEPILDSAFTTDQQLLTKTFLAILLGLIIWDIMPYIIGKGKKTLSFVLAVIITVLAMIAIPANFLTAILLQYGIMGASILSVIPFVIVLLASIRIQSALIARVLWLFYTVYYFAVYLYMTILAYKSGGIWYWVTVETIPYLAAILVGMIMLFGIVKVHRLIFKGEMETIKEEGVRIVKRGRLLHELNQKELEEVYGKKDTGPITYS